MNHLKDRRIYIPVANPWWAYPVAVKKLAWRNRKHPYLKKSYSVSGRKIR